MPKHNNNNTAEDSDFTDFVEAPSATTSHTTTSTDKQTQIIVEKIKALAGTINDLPKLQ